MNDEKAIIIFGREEGIDSYQLLIGLNYTSTTYCKTNRDYNDFLNEVSANFAEKILNANLSLELRILNGFKIGKQGIVRVEKLDDKSFESLLTNKLKQLSKGRAAVLPTAEITN
jgi:hypothetical protein